MIYTTAYFFGVFFLFICCYFIGNWKDLDKYEQPYDKVAKWYREEKARRNNAGKRRGGPMKDDKTADH